MKVEHSGTQKADTKVDYKVVALVEKKVDVTVDRSGFEVAASKVESWAV